MLYLADAFSFCTVKTEFSFVKLRSSYEYDRLYLNLTEDTFSSGFGTERSEAHVCVAYK